MAIPRPKRLPGRYRQIWQALRRADERALSRVELCRRLGVSTHTVQRILVDGDVPDFTKQQSTRLTRSWARAVTRLACGLGGEPRSWIEGLGIAWDDGVRRASEATERKLRGGSPRRGLSQPVEAGTVNLRPFADPGPSDTSFFEEYARRLIGAVEPDREVRVRPGTAADLVDDLTSSNPRLSLALGIFETGHLRGRGLAVLPLPGWRLAFTAVSITSRGASPLRWEGIAGRGVRVLVQEGDPARGLVRSHWGCGPERVLMRRPASAEALAEDLRRTWEERPHDPLALVADEETCRRVIEELGRHRAFGRAFTASRIPSPAEERPRFQLGVAVRSDSGRWLELLEYAWREELFGSSRAATARLYSDLLVTASRTLFPAVEVPVEAPTNACPEPFVQANEDFQRVLSRRLISTLREKPPAGEGDEGWDRLVRRARSLVPCEWRPTLDETAWAARLEASSVSPRESRPFRTYCHSCSGSLREYPSPSPSYCRFCADEEGRLLPRDEVHGIIAHWMTLWQDGISEEEARERATLYMSAMPAWS
jgi:hypothetical protein